MLYAIIASDVANSLEKRLAARPAHIERLQQGSRQIQAPLGRCRPVSTGLGEVLMWTVDFAHPDGRGAPRARAGQPGWQTDGSYLTPEGQRLTTLEERLTYLRTVQDWIIRPQMRMETLWCMRFAHHMTAPRNRIRSHCHKTSLHHITK